MDTLNRVMTILVLIALVIAGFVAAKGYMSNPNGGHARPT
jgi:hypothetical protein